MTNTHLNDEEKFQIEMLAADGQSLNKIGKLVKRSPHTVSKHLEQPDVQQRVQTEKERLSTIYREKALQIVESINKVDISRASLQQKSISSGVLLDKSLLLAGEVPTFRVEVLLAAVDAIRAQRKQEELAYLKPSPQLPAESD